MSAKKEPEGQLTDPNDHISRVLRLPLEEVLQNHLCALGIPGLRVESGAGIMGRHAVAPAKGVLHCTPWVVLGCRLYIPHISGIAVELAAHDRLGYVVSVADGSTGGVNEPCALRFF